MGEKKTIVRCNKTDAESLVAGVGIFAPQRDLKIVIVFFCLFVFVTSTVVFTCCK